MSDPMIGLTLTPAELKNVILHVFQKEAEPLLTKVLATMQTLQDDKARLLDVVQAMEARLTQLEQQPRGVYRLTDADLH